MLAVAVTDIQALYESQPLLTQVGGFSSLATDTEVEERREEEDDSAG